MIQKADSLQQFISRVDTLLVIPENLKSYEGYIDLLEKSNQQLSMWSNPYSFLVAVLSVLFTVLTVAAAVLLYRQSEEYKSRYTNLFVSSEKKINELREELVSTYNTMIKNLKNESETITERLESIKKEIEEHGPKDKGYSEKLDELESELKEVKGKAANLQIGHPNIVTAEPFFSIYPIKIHSCSKCNHQFSYQNSSGGMFVGLVGNQTVKCPKCGNIDII